uniref:Sec1 family domain-containing protein 2 n=3 Tax=Lygus hesperus TaxID=30085 RepID=A0A146LWX9_LYGHE
MVLSIKYASSSVWQEVCKKVKDAAVFIDAPAGECVSWHGGIRLLMDSGATSVKEFSSFESGESALKAVFIVSTPLTGTTRIILRDLISNSKFQHCILITSCSPTVLTLATTGNVSENTEEMTALHKLETDMLHWMKNKDYAVEIFHLLISCLPISDSLFTFPQFSHIMPCFTQDLIGKTPYSSLPRNLDVEALPLELQVGIVHIMTTLSSLLSKLSARESIYCLGMISSLVGSQLQKHSTSAVRLRNAEHNMSLILIDRNLDLCGPLMMSPPVQSTLMDQIKSVLPPLPSHSVDVAIDMSPLCHGTGIEVEGFTPVAPGCLHDPESEWIDALIHRPTPEIVPHLYKRLSEALNLNDIPAKVTPQHLQDLVTKHFDKNYEMMKKHSSMIQASVGVLGALNSEKINALEVVESLQKMILQSIAAENGTNEAIQHLIAAVLERRDRGLSVDSVFVLLVFLYSLIGRQFQVDQYLEKGLKDVVLEMMTEEVTKDHSSVIVNRVKEDSNVADFVNKFFVRLEALKNCRQHMDKYVNVARNHGSASPLEYEGILSQVLYDVVDVTRPDIPDLKYKANISLRNNLASRFTMILNSSKPHVMDNDVILVFVIGGITGHEIKQINNIFRIYGKRVIIGSTTLLSPAQVLDNLFLQDPLRPFSL